jgi:hypothetical protein
MAQKGTPQPSVRPQPQSQLQTQTQTVSRQPKAMKIPNLADYLELEGSLLSSNPSLQGPQLKSSKFAREPKV